MVDDALTSATRALAAWLFRLAMRIIPAFPAAALCAALGLAAEPAPVWADSPVVIEGADEDTRRAIIDLLPDRDEPTSLFEAERIAEEAAARALAWLRSEGYYAATVTPEAGEAPAVARIVIAPGQRFRFNPPTITFDGSEPSQGGGGTAAREALQAIEAGAPARAETVLASEDAALLALQQAGYPDAIAGERRIVVDHATTRVSPAFRFASGEFARLGRVRAEPEGVLRPSLVERLRNWDVGDPYAPGRLARIRRDLTSTGAISLATTELGPPDEHGVRDVVVHVEPARRNAYELGFGYSTTEGIGVEAEWTRRNVTGRADSLTISTTLGELLQSGTIELSRPHAAGLGHTRNYGINAAREDTDAYERRGVALYASVDADPRLNFAQSYGARFAADTYNDNTGGISNALVLSGFWDVRRDTTDVRLDPRDGSILNLRLEPTVSTGDATLAFMRAIGEARLYQSFGADNRLTLAGRARAGWLEPISGDLEDAPPDRRFYAGGGGSVRGYGYNSIYPPERARVGVTPGGQGLFETSIEARWRFNDRWGAAAFVDGGNAFDDWQEAGDLRWGVGAGIRYDLGFAPLRVDIAFPLDENETSDDFALYISLGQAF